MKPQIIRRIATRAKNSQVCAALKIAFNIAGLSSLGGGSFLLLYTFYAINFSEAHEFLGYETNFFIRSIEFGLSVFSAVYLVYLAIPIIFKMARGYVDATK